ncbi:hypothetical protein [Rhodanobacter sp. Root179]|uniref:hypothetical protein n=1 Tax=Rhodanobacter sp. Root179 TaxID=1736482 RepID=UPI0012F8624D|nr:hypothetical protein [Rhodanobacter sp. Root179]
MEEMLARGEAVMVAVLAYRRQVASVPVAFDAVQRNDGVGADLRAMAIKTGRLLSTATSGRHTPRWLMQAFKSAELPLASGSSPRQAPSTAKSNGHRIERRSATILDRMTAYRVTPSPPRKNQAGRVAR